MHGQRLGLVFGPFPTKFLVEWEVSESFVPGNRVTTRQQNVRRRADFSVEIESQYKTRVLDRGGNRIMPRLLFIAHAYPPLPAAGSVRAGGLAKYLPHFGWDVLVLTAKLPPGPRPPARVVETEYEDVI